MTRLPGMKKAKLMLIDPNSIRTDLGTQPRVELDQEIVQYYAEAMRKGASFPRILLFYDPELNLYILVDGLHRFEAFKLVQPDHKIQADVVEGTLEQAQWFSYSMNATHGLNRSNADKNRAVRLALQHKMGADKSNCEIAAHVGVDEKMVRRIRQELESTSALPKSSKRIGRDGRTINTEQIGRSTTKTVENLPKPGPVPVVNVNVDESKPLHEPPCPNKDVTYFPKTTLKLISQETPHPLLANLFAHFRKGFVEEMVIMAMEMLQDSCGEKVVRKIMRQLNKKYGKPSTEV